MILIGFKIYFHQSRLSDTLNFNKFLQRLVKVKNLEKGPVLNNKQKHNMFLKKWSIVENVLPTIHLPTYIMNNKALIETGNSGRGLVLRCCFFLL